MKKVIVILIAIAIAILYFLYSNIFLNKNVTIVKDISNKTDISNKEKQNFIKSKKSLAKIKSEQKSEQEILDFKSGISFEEAYSRVDIFMKDDSIDNNTKAKKLWKLAKQDLDGELFFLCIDYLKELDTMQLTPELIKIYDDINNKNNRLKMIELFDSMQSISEENFSSSSFNEEEDLKNSELILKKVQDISSNASDSDIVWHSSKVYMNYLGNSLAKDFLLDKLDSNNLSKTEKIELAISYIDDAQANNQLKPESLEEIKTRLELDDNVDELSSVIHSSLIEMDVNDTISSNSKNIKNLFLGYEEKNRTQLSRKIVNKEQVSTRELSTTCENIAFMQYFNLTPKEAIKSFIVNDATAYEIVSLYETSSYLTNKDIRDLKIIEKIETLLKTIDKKTTIYGKLNKLLK